MSETILAVDDDVDILELIQMSLTVEGFDVITANDGMSGLEKARTSSPDLILLDLMMPVMDGFEVIDKLKADEQTRAIPVIMLTARAQTHERVQGLHAGADDYVTKPFDLDELTARIEAVLGRTLPAKYINPLISTMGDWFTEEGVEQLAAHLETAAVIQQNLIPKKAPNLPGFDIAGFLRSSMTVSGDFYDFIPLDNSRLGIAIADVRGKGIPAALLMVMIRTTLRLICREETSPAAALKRINDLLAIDTDPDLFATMVYGILDPGAKTFTYSSAGHCYPLHLKNGGTEVAELKVGGMILGTFDHAVFESETIPLASGDELLLYTDGVTETERTSDETFYGEERLAEILQLNGHQPAETFCQTIETALFDFSGTDHRDDDVTIVVIKATEGKE
jgi:sigma-B regulation protein RsbU (phosphoserine phosphatase)